MSPDLEQRLVSELKQYVTENLPLSKISDEELEERIEDIVEQRLAGQYCSIEQRLSIVRQIYSSIRGFGLLDSIISDDTITEVMINGCDALFYERGGEICQAETRFDSPEQIMIAIDRILAPLGRRLDRASPLVSARLPNGDRVNAVADPISIDGPSITIRKFSDRAWTLRRLVGLGALPAWYATLLSWAVRTKCGIAVAGGTGSGKTTLLNGRASES